MRQPRVSTSTRAAVWSRYKLAAGASRSNVLTINVDRRRAQKTFAARDRAEGTPFASVVLDVQRNAGDKFSTSPSAIVERRLLLPPITSTDIPVGYTMRRSNRMRSCSLAAQRPHQRSIGADRFSSRSKSSRRVWNQLRSSSTNALCIRSAVVSGQNRASLRGILLYRRRTDRADASVDAP